MEFPTRIDNPSHAALPELEARLLEGQSLLVQFADPTYTADLLAKLDELCARFGAQLELRFYGHHQTGFDGRTLASLPNVVKLCVDCLTQATHTDALQDLHRLAKLSLGIEALEDEKILRFANLRKLTWLAVTETKKTLDLSYLGGFTDLEELRLHAHERGLPIIKSLPKLRDLRLISMSKRVPLAFLADMPLRNLMLVLGGRESIAEIAGATLETFEVTRVRGLVELGDMSRFPALRTFFLEDQARVERIAFGSSTSPLEYLRISTCKKLTAIDGLASLPHLHHLRIIDSAMGPTELLALPLPPSLKICALFTPRETENCALRQALDARGYTAA